MDKKTILRWVEDDGLTIEDREAVREVVATEHARKAAAANARIAEERAKARERVITNLAKVSEAALLRELQLLAAGGFTNDDLQALTNSREKAVRSLELLEGRATVRRGVDADAAKLIAAIASVFEHAIAGLPEVVRHSVTRAFADGIRELETREVLELEAGEAQEHDAVEGEQR